MLYNYNKFCWPRLLGDNFETIDINNQEYQSNCPFDQWLFNYNKKFAYRIYSDLESLDLINKRVYIQKPEEQNINVNSFSNPLFINTEEIADDEDGYDIQLKLPEKHICFVIDNSGSMTWKDPNKTRYDLINTIVGKINDVYPEDVTYSLVRFGGKIVKTQTIATTESENPFNEVIKKDTLYSKDPFSDKSNNLYGVRLVRNKDRYPINPIDGDFIYEGTGFSVSDTLDYDTNYYYKLFTFNSNYVFSEGLDLKINLKNTERPLGLKTIKYEQFNGTGVAIDNDVLSSWHMNEKEKYVYDFNSEINLEFSSEGYRYLDKTQVPVGNSGIKLDGGTFIYSIDTNNYLKLNNYLTFMGWVKPISFSSTNPIISRSNVLGTNIDYEIVIQTNGKILVKSRGSNLATSTGSLVVQEWTHIAVTISNSQLKIYINGSLDSTHSISLSAYSSDTYYLEIGHSNNLSTFFKGSITEFSLHSVVRDLTYIQEYAQNRVIEEEDNGDRLLVFKYEVPDKNEFLNKKLVVVKNTERIPSWEEDGDEIYNEDLTSGEGYFTYRENFILNKDYYFKFYIKDDNENYSSNTDSLEIYVKTNNISEEALSLIDDLNIENISGVSITSGYRKNILEWNINTDTNVSSVFVFYGEDKFPSIEKNNSNNSLIYFGDPQKNRFVHLSLINDKKYYYSIVFADRYGRISEVYNDISTPDSLSADEEIKPIDCSYISYNQDNDSVNISWDYKGIKKDIEAYFNDKVIIFSKIVDLDGNIINDEDLIYEVTESVTFNKDEESFDDVFSKENTNFTTSDLYELVSSKSDNGIFKTTIYCTDNARRLFNYSSAKFYINITIYKQTESNKIILKTEQIEIYLKNPFSVKLENRDNKKVSFICRNILDSLNHQVVNSLVELNGQFINSSNPYYTRVYLENKNSFISSGAIVKTGVYKAIGDICDINTLEVGDKSSNVIVDESLILLKTEELDILDKDGNKTGLKEKRSYIDIPIISPSVPENVFLYVKATYNGYSFVKRIIIAFKNTLNIEIYPNIPVADGVGIFEQFANSYIVDPDSPDDIALRQYPDDNTVVKWSLTNESGTCDKIFYSLDDVPIINGVYSYLTNGSTKNIFIGPISNITSLEKLTLQAEITFNGKTVFDKYPIYLYPSTSQSQKNQNTDSFILFEPESIKQEAFCDGEELLLKIVNDPNTSTTTYSDCFRQGMADLGKSIYKLTSGTLLTIKTNVNYVSIYDDVLGQYVSREARIYVSSDDFTYVKVKISKNVVDENKVTSISDNSVLNTQCLNGINVPKYEKEAIISCSGTIVVENNVVKLFGGGNFGESIIPFILVPKNPLSIELISNSVDSVDTQGISLNNNKNKLKFIVKYKGNYLDLNKQNAVSITFNNYMDYIGSYSSNPTLYNYVNTYFDLELTNLSNKSSYITILNVNLSYDNNSKKYTRYIYRDSNQSSEESIYSIFSKNAKRCNLANVNKVWEDISDMNHERAGFACSANSSAKIYVFSGINSFGLTSSVEEFSLASGAWTEKTDIPTPRFGSASVNNSNYIYVIGGISKNEETGEFIVSNKIERYNSSTDEWVELENIPIDYDSYSDENRGLAFCSALYKSGYIYVFCGITKIYNNYNKYIYNNRVFIYNISSDLWTVSEEIDSSLLYERINCGLLNSGNNIYIAGGFNDNISEKEYIYPLKYNILTDSLSNDDDNYLGTMNNKSHSGFASTGNYLYRVGGGNSKSLISNDIDFLDYSSSPYQYDSFSSTEKISRSLSMTGCCITTTASAPYSNNNYLFVFGGRKNQNDANHININIINFNNNFKIDGLNNFNLRFSLNKENGDLLEENVRVNIKAYINLNNKKYEVGLLYNEYNIQNGYGDIILTPRGEDLISSVIEEIDFSDTERYSIYTNIKIIDETYFGQTFADTIFEDLDTNKINPIIRATDYITKDVEIISYSNEKIIPYVETVSSSQNTLEEFLLLLDESRKIRDIGFSPIYDAFNNVDNILSKEDFSGTEKQIIFITDGDENLSKNNMLDSIDVVNSIGGFKNTPVIFADLENYVSVTNLDSYTQSNSRNLNYIGSMTGGQSIPIIDNNNLLYYTNSITSTSTGSLGWGYVMFDYSFESDVLIKTLKVNFDLPSNSSAKWRFSTSKDGYQYTEYSNYIYYNEEYVLKNVIGKYIKFEVEIISGLSSQIDPYAFSPISYNPKIKSVDIKYCEPVKEYIYMNKEEYSDKVKEISVSLTTNVDYNNRDISIKLGSSPYNSHNYSDFSFISNDMNSIQSIIPLRDRNEERLVSLNNFVFRPINGKWYPDSSVEVYNGDELLSDLDYTLCPREGYVCFNKIMINKDNLKIKIINKNIVKSAIEITTFNSDKNVYIYGAGFFINEK